jgi:hypothetical protein
MGAHAAELTEPETDAAVHACEVCKILPDDQAELRNHGSPEPGSRFSDYWICRDSAACLRRLIETARRAAQDAADGVTAGDSGPGTGEADDVSAPEAAGPGEPEAVPGPVQDKGAES